MNSSQGNLVGEGVGSDQKFVLRSRKVLALLLMLLPAFGFTPEAVKQLGAAGELVVPAIASLLLLWSMIRADGAQLSWRPKFSWIQKLKLGRAVSKVLLVALCLVPLGCIGIGGTFAPGEGLKLNLCIKAGDNGYKKVIGGLDKIGVGKFVDGVAALAHCKPTP